MQKLWKKIGFPACLGMLASAFPAYTMASNGMYMGGYGLESSLMGGADVAVSRDAFAANNNPAGLSQLSGQALDIEIDPWVSWNVDHSDSFGNNRKARTNNLGLFGNAAYARHLENTPFTTGISFVVQGGVGWTYSGLNTPFGGRDDASALFTIIKLAPAIAWEVNDRLSLGVAVGINYLGGNQELFPNTSTATFSGFRFKDASGIGLSSKWGLQYRPAKDVIVGVTYGTQSSIPMKDGTLRINYTNSIPGQGIVRYDNAKLTGFRLPEELAIGVAFRPVPQLLLSLQEKWYNWSDAINRLELTATNPRGAGVPPTVSMPLSADFNDQHVYAAGFAYDYNKDTLILGGINYGRRPLPDQNQSPIFAPNQTLHYLIGISRKIDTEWEVGSGVEWYVPKSVTYNSPLFGPDATERTLSLLFHLSVARRW